MNQLELTRLFKALPQITRDNLQLLVDIDLEQARGLEDKLKELILRMKGKVSYLYLSCQLGEIVCADTICTHIMIQEVFRYWKDCLLPHLDATARKWRVIWGQAF